MVTVQFHEFGVRLNFVPTITPRGTIQLKDSAGGQFAGLYERAHGSRLQYSSAEYAQSKTEVELGDGQSFAIAGLLDRRVTDTFSKMPLIGDLPVLGKLFRSKGTTRNNTELLVIVTPELVRPMPAGAPEMNLSYPKTFMDSSPVTALQDARAWQNRRRSATTFGKVHTRREVIARHRGRKGLRGQGAD